MLRYLSLFLVMFCFVGCKGHTAAAEGLRERIQYKASTAQERVQDLMAHGYDVRPIVAQMQKIPQVVKKQGGHKAEELLDKIHKDMDALEASGASLRASLPASNAFSEAKPVEMVGYDGHIMEPFLSRDDQYLFFNNLNDPGVNTNIHYAKRLDVNRFQYLGEVKGINTKALEGVPTIDPQGNFFFISPRSYEQTYSTIYAGRFKDGTVSDVRILPGTVNGRKPPIFNMGVEISADGQTLYYSESVGRDGGGPPVDSNIRFGYRQGDSFVVALNAEHIMQHVNTPDELEYAVSITEDELEMFFSRSKILIQGNKTAGADLKIMVSRRASKNEPFGKPQLIQTITGFSEAPAISSDGRIVYFHKKNEKGIFRLYRVERAKL